MKALNRNQYFVCSIWVFASIRQHFFSFGSWFSCMQGAWYALTVLVSDTNQKDYGTPYPEVEFAQHLQFMALSYSCMLFPHLSIPLFTKSPENLESMFFRKPWSHRLRVHLHGIRSIPAAPWTLAVAGTPRPGWHSSLAGTKTGDEHEIFETQTWSRDVKIR